MSAARPKPRGLAPAGCEWVAHVEADWRLAIGGRCRAGSGNGKRACGAPAVAELNRRRRRSDNSFANCWWSYCAAHLYGRWIEDYQVVGWRLKVRA